jgi:AcrR family transcriptional regulator
MPTETRPRLTAAERRDQLIVAALSEFARGGLHGTATETIARRAGISHAYLFRLFPTKKALFIACAEECVARTLATFRAAVSGERPEERMQAMGRGYREMLADRELLLMQMQLYAACSDPEIRDVARAGFDRLRAEVAALSGAQPDELQAFFARGMLLNVAASIDQPALGDPEAWEAT